MKLAIFRIPLDDYAAGRWQPPDDTTTLQARMDYQQRETVVVVEGQGTEVPETVVPKHEAA